MDLGLKMETDWIILCFPISVSCMAKYDVTCLTKNEDKQCLLCFSFVENLATPLWSLWPTVETTVRHNTCNELSCHGSVSSPSRLPLTHRCCLCMRPGVPGTLLDAGVPAVGSPVVVVPFSWSDPWIWMGWSAAGSLFSVPVVTPKLFINLSGLKLAPARVVLFFRVLQWLNCEHQSDYFVQKHVVLEIDSKSTSPSKSTSAVCVQGKT